MIILDTDLGYALTEHVQVDVGLPIIFTRSPFSPVINHDFYTSTLFGEPYLNASYTGVYRGVNFASMLTVTVPVANEDRIYSTGRFGVDWFNHIEQQFGDITPFLNFGASNGTLNRFIMPRPFSEARPFQTLGALGDFEAGAEYKMRQSYAKGFGIGASAYLLTPAGPQKVFSRLVVPYSSLGGDGQHLRYFDNTFETKNPAQVPDLNGCSTVNNVVSCKAGLSSIARDNGYSAWLDVSRWHPVDIQLGYTRSVHYHLDVGTLTFTFDGRSLIRTLTGR